MITKSTKICDLCGDEVAIQYEILYHTVKPFVTIRLDEPTTYSNMDEHTTKSKMHFCTDCFYKISEQAAKELNKNAKR